MPQLIAPLASKQLTPISQWVCLMPGLAAIWPLLERADVDMSALSAMPFPTTGFVSTAMPAKTAEPAKSRAIAAIGNRAEANNRLVASDVRKIERRIWLWVHSLEKYHP